MAKNHHHHHHRVLFSILLLSISKPHSHVVGQAVEFEPAQDAVSCPSVPPDEDEIRLSMAGLPSANYLVDAWKQRYQTEYCPQFQLNLEGDSYPSGAARVCANSLVYNPVDMAGMGGSFFQPQASTSDGWSFQCTRSTLERKTILLHIAQEGIGVNVAPMGPAASCLEVLGGGLTIAQLRWIFSSFGTNELISSGWDRTSVPFLDEDDSTHLWSELHENCTAVEIDIAAEEGAGEEGTGAHVTLEFFQTRVLTAWGETLRGHYQSLQLSDLDQFLQRNGAAIAFSHLSDTLSLDFQARNIAAVGIVNHHGNVIVPTSRSFEKASYPLLRKIHVGVVDDPNSLALTRPFLEFGYSEEGTEILKSVGFWPLRDWEKLTMYTRLNSEKGLDVDVIRASCGPEDGVIPIGGSGTVNPVAFTWSEIYKLGCPSDITVGDRGSTAGAHRVCGDVDYGTPVTIGMMSRGWGENEASRRMAEDQSFVYDCRIGDERRSVIQLDVALDGITTMFTRGGFAHKCVEMLGGLTTDQLRWIFSDYTDAELLATGWEPRSLENSDNDSTTHLWSELDSRCATEEIQLSGDYWGDGSFVSFSKKVLADFGNGEVIARNRVKPYVEAYADDALKYMLDHPDAISYTGYHYFYENQDLYWAAPIQNSEGVFVIPSEKTIEDGSYPLVRSIFMNVLNDEEALQDAAPLLEFGYSRPDLVVLSGYVPISGAHKVEMLDRLRGAPYFDYLGNVEGDEEEEVPMGVLIGVIAGVLALICLCICAIAWIVRDKYT